MATDAADLIVFRAFDTLRRGLAAHIGAFRRPSINLGPFWQSGRELPHQYVKGGRKDETEDGHADHPGKDGDTQSLAHIGPGAG